MPITKERFKVVLALTCVLGIVLVPFLLGCFGLPSLVIYACTGRFQLTAKQYHEDTRKVRQGMTRDEVIAVMGRPHSRHANHDGTETWFYCTSILFNWGVNFDKEGRVTNTWVD